MHAQLEVFRKDMDEIKQDLEEEKAAEEEEETAEEDIEDETGAEEANLSTTEPDHNVTEGDFSPRTRTDSDQTLESGVEHTAAKERAVWRTVLLWSCLSACANLSSEAFGMRWWQSAT